MSGSQPPPPAPASYTPVDPAPALNEIATLKLRAKIAAAVFAVTFSAVFGGWYGYDKVHEPKSLPSFTWLTPSPSTSYRPPSPSIVISMFDFTLSPSASETVMPLSVNMSVRLTFYGAKDNCPPSAEVSHPVVHALGGGTGTWADPITFAGPLNAMTYGQRVYVFAYSKYFVLEDYCQECTQEHAADPDAPLHLDLWMGPSAVVSDPHLIMCENALSLASTAVMINPPPNLPVSTAVLFDHDTSTCLLPTSQCVDIANDCGNYCEIPTANTCTGLASLFSLSMSRFLALNPTIACSGTIPAGTSVCMGGTCGD